jgi:hypothetical protein
VKDHVTDFYVGIHNHFTDPDDDDYARMEAEARQRIQAQRAQNEAAMQALRQRASVAPDPGYEGGSSDPGPNGFDVLMGTLLGVGSQMLQQQALQSQIDASKDDGGGATGRACWDHPGHDPTVHHCENDPTAAGNLP